MYRSSHSSDGSVETVVGQDVSINNFNVSTAAVSSVSQLPLKGCKGKREGNRWTAEQEALRHLHR